MSQVDTKSRPTCMALSSLGVSVESAAATATGIYASEEGTNYPLEVKNLDSC